MVYEKRDDIERMIKDAVDQFDKNTVEPETEDTVVCEKKMSGSNRIK